MALLDLPSRPRYAGLDPDVARMLRVQRGEPGAFAELVERYWVPIVGRFFRQLGDRQEAEDLAQDVFLRLFRARVSYRPTARFSTWLFHIAANVARNAVRTRRRRPCKPLGQLSGGESDDEFARRYLPDRREGPTQPLERAELARQVRSALGELADRQRAAIELQFQDRTYQEIASRLAMTPKAAKSLLYRARQQLRESLGTVVDPV
jgi:RNA polymerase sigma-70 factor, ECF subfamily